MGNTNPGILARVFRFNPGCGEGQFQDFWIDTKEALSVMTIMAKVHEMEPDFACRTSMCFKGFCGSCLVRANGNNVKGCVTLVQPGETVVLEPYTGFKVIRDLVVDFSLPDVESAEGEEKV